MNLADIVEAIQAGRIRITNHARKEARADNLTLDEIMSSLVKGEIIEDYPKDWPFPSCLVYGPTSNGDPVHSVWAYNQTTESAVLITVYRPDAESWINWRRRRGANDSV